MKFGDYWSKVDMRGLDECWPWLGGKVRGRGVLWVDEERRNVTAPRIAASIAGILKSLDDPLFACHRCNNPECVNPRHLYAGTNRDNIRDAAEAGRLYGQQFTHCPHGHPFSGDNVAYRKNSRSRICRTCMRASDQAWRDKNREARNAKRKIARAALAPAAEAPTKTEGPADA